MFSNANCEKKIDFQMSVALIDFKSRFHGSYHAKQDLNFICLNSRFYDAALAQESAKLVAVGIKLDPAIARKIYENLKLENINQMLNFE